MQNPGGELPYARLIIDNEDMMRNSPIPVRRARRRCLGTTHESIRR
jgi:hypothetical protein